MDLVFKKDRHIVIVEMEQFSFQANDIKDYEYLYSIAGSQFSVGEKYSNAKTSLILFANYVPNKLRDIDEKLFDYKFMNAKYNIVKQYIESYEIILPNFHKMNYNECNEIEKFLWLFSCKSIKEMKSNVDNDEDMNIIHELERLNMDDTFRFEYDNEIVQKKLVNSAKDEGFDAGVQMEKLRSIKALFDQGVSLEIIANVYELTVEEVKEIIDIKD